MPNALVTGTSSGLGELTAKRLLTLGWDVTGASRRSSNTSHDDRFETITLDLADQASIAEAAAHVGERHARLDALVSNAGYGLLGPWEEMTSQELRDQLEVNLVGTMALCRACLPLLRDAAGVIVQVSSVSGQEGEALFGAYSASKFGLEGASEALAAEVERQGIRVVIVEPGPFRTEIADKSPVPAGRGSTGLYEEMWRENDEWLDWFRGDAEDPELAVDAIVAAATVPGAPFRIPVGTGAGMGVREHAERIIADVERAEAFLRDFRGAELPVD
jgi:NAD(P)-dependent dehydrogenase (short-subunit alcohol dehydrogenase family)